MYKIKSVSENFGFLTHLNTEELRSVLNDENKLEEIVKDVKQCKDIEKEKEMLLVSNRSLAEYNLNQEPLLILSKKQLIELSEICQDLCKSIDNKFSGSAPKWGVNSLETKLSVLQMATQEMEEESEGIAESFLDGSIEIDDFLERFMQRRKIMHLRRVKADKMKEIINEHLNSRSNPRINPQTPYPPSSYYRPQPYDLNGVIRPMY